MKTPLFARGVLVALACLAGAELALRRACGSDPAAAERLFLEENRYLYSQSQGPFFRRQGSMWTNARPRANPTEFPVAKEKTELRVIVAGESVAQRMGATDLEEVLALFFPGRRARVVNCGMGTYDSYRVADVVSRSSDYSPDLFVVLAGNNDGARPERVYYPVYRLNLALRGFWLWRLPQDALSPRGLPDREAVDARFAGHLREMARAAKRMNVPIVFCTLPVNARDFPPVSEGPAMASYMKGKELERQGDRTGARRELQRAVALDYPDRCTKDRNELIRRVAKEEGAALADLEFVFGALAVHAAPGWDLFGDGVHFRPRTFPIVARTIAAAAAHPEKPLRDVLPWPVFDPSWKPGKEVDAVMLSGTADALQASLQSPPVHSERAVAQFMLAAKADPDGLRRLTADPEGLARKFRENPSTAPLAPEVGKRMREIDAHVLEAIERVKRAFREEAAR